MAKRKTCRACGKGLTERAGPGPRAAYCSVGCRRAVEYARRRWDARVRQAAALERAAAGWLERGPRFNPVRAQLLRWEAARLRRAAGKRP